MARRARGVVAGRVTGARSRRFLALGLVAVLVGAQTAPAWAANRGFSQVRTLDVTQFSRALAPGDSPLAVFDITVYGILASNIELSVL